MFDLLSFEITAVTGVIATFCLALLTKYRTRQRFDEAIIELKRHIDASMDSIDQITPDHPIYFVSARILYCQFLSDVDGLRVDWLPSKKVRLAHTRLLLSIRNSDIFVNEIAKRVDAMSREELVKSLEEVKVNLQILSEAVERFTMTK
jgi:hypothetical protein